MQEHTPKFRLRLNLFDTIVLLFVLGVGGFFLWSAMTPEVPDDVPAPSVSQITYTISIAETIKGTGDIMIVGDKLTDAAKNLALGTMDSITVTPSTRYVLDEDAMIMRLAEVPNREKVEIVLTSTGTITDTQITLSSGQEIRVGQLIYVRGAGYLGTGYITNIERGTEQ